MSTGPECLKDVAGDIAIGQGAATSKSGADRVVFLGSAADLRPLIVRPYIKSFADLTVLVDPSR